MSVDSSSKASKSPSQIGLRIKALIDDGKYEEARKLVRDNPSSKSAAVMDRIDLEEARSRSIPGKDEMAAIKKAIAEKRYDEAEKQLLLSDHPDADKYLQQLAVIRANITNLDGRPQASRAVNSTHSKIKDNDVSPEKSIAVLFWFLCALAAFVASISKLFN